MKRIYITEDIAKELSEITKPISDLPNDIKNVLRNHKTSLGMHPSFPPEEEIPFDMLITKNRFEEVLSKMNKLNIDNYLRPKVRSKTSGHEKGGSQGPALCCSVMITG